MLDVTPLRRHPAFRRLWFGQGISFIGTEIAEVALAYQMYQLTGSTLAVGLISLTHLVPLVTLTMSDLPLNRMANGTGLFNLLRQLGGSVGIAVAATLLSRFEATHRAQLVEHVSIYSEPTRARLGEITARLLASGTPSPLVQSKALQILDLQINRQAMMLSFEQLFLLFGAALACALPLLFFMRRPGGTRGSASAH